MHGRLRRCSRHAAFALLAVVAEVAGRSLTGRVDQALHVAPLAPKGAAYYPFALVAIKVVAALALAGLLARLVRARVAADAGNRMLEAAGHARERLSPRLRPTVSARVWAAAFAASSLVYLVQADAEGASQSRWSLLSPWLHTYALPVFAAVAVLVAVAWSVLHWVREVEEYAVRTLARARGVLGAAPLPRRGHAPAADDLAPRRRFGLAFECRPPPLAATA